MSSFSKKEKNETFKEFKLGNTNTREDLNIEKSKHTHESIRNHQSVKQLYMTLAIKKDCIKKLRDRRVKDQLTSNSKVHNVKLIRNKYRLKPRYDHCLNITIFQDKEKAYLVKKSRYDKEDCKYMHMVKLKKSNGYLMFLINWKEVRLRNFRGPSDAARLQVNFFLFFFTATQTP